MPYRLMGLTFNLGFGSSQKAKSHYAKFFAPWLPVNTAVTATVNKQVTGSFR